MPLGSEGVPWRAVPRFLCGKRMLWHVGLAAVISHLHQGHVQCQAGDTTALDFGRDMLSLIMACYLKDANISVTKRVWVTFSVVRVRHAGG